MKERIIENEEKLNTIILAINKLETSLDDFDNLKEIIKELDNYYGSKAWFKDKEQLEKGKIKNIKAGVLSEDAVWNVFESIKDLAEKMKTISNRILNKE